MKPGIFWDLDPSKVKVVSIKLPLQYITKKKPPET